MGRYVNARLFMGTRGNPQENLFHSDYATKVSSLIAETIRRQRKKEEKKDEEDTIQDKKRRRPVARFPRKKAQLMHIFRKAEGHFEKDTRTNRRLILNAIQRKYYKGISSHDRMLYSRIIKSGEKKGKQIWVYVRDGVISDCGINRIPRKNIGGINIYD